MTPNDALAELQRCSGTQFDPEVVVAVHAALSQPSREVDDEPVSEASAPGVESS